MKMRPGQKRHFMIDILRDYAPETVEARHSIHEMETEMISNLSEDEIVWTISGVLQDGIRHGNWPWTGHAPERMR